MLIEVMHVLLGLGWWRVFNFEEFTYPEVHVNFYVIWSCRLENRVTCVYKMPALEKSKAGSVERKTEVMNTQLCITDIIFYK